MRLQVGTMAHRAGIERVARVFLLRQRSTIAYSSSFLQRGKFSTSSSSSSSSSNTSNVKELLPDVQIVTIKHSDRAPFEPAPRPKEEKVDLPPEAYILHRNWSTDFPNERLFTLSTDSLRKLSELLGLPTTVPTSKMKLIVAIDMYRDEEKDIEIPEYDYLKRLKRTELVALAEQLGISTRTPASDEFLLDRIKIVRNYLMHEADTYLDRFVNEEDRLLYQHGQDYLKHVCRELGVRPDGTAYQLTKKLRGQLAVLSEHEKMLLNYFHMDEIHAFCQEAGIDTEKARITLIRRLDSMRLAQLSIQERIRQATGGNSSGNSNSLDFSWNDDPVEWARQCNEFYTEEQLRTLCQDWSDRYNHRKRYSKIELIKQLCRALKIKMPDNPAKQRRKFLDEQKLQLRLKLGDDQYVEPVTYSGADPLGTAKYGALRKDRPAEMWDEVSDDDSSDDDYDDDSDYHSSSDDDSDGSDSNDNTDETDYK